MRHLVSVRLFFYFTHLTTSLQHVSEWQEGDHDIGLRRPVFSKLHNDAAH